MSSHLWSSAASRLPLAPLCVFFFSLRRDAVQKSAIANLVSLVSLYGDQPDPPRATSEARSPSAAARRSLPYLEVSSTNPLGWVGWRETERQKQKEKREANFLLTCNTLSQTGCWISGHQHYTTIRM